MKRRTWLMLMCLCLVCFGVASCKFTLRDVELPTGVRLNFAELENAEAHDQIVFLHGYTDSWFSFSRVLQRLPNRIHAFSLSQRGHGDSSKPEQGYSQADFTGDLLAFMDTEHLDKAIIIGHSMGSMVAHKFASEHPQRVKKLILIGTAATMVGREDFAGFLDAITQDPSLCSDPSFVRSFQEGTVYTGAGAAELPSLFLDKVIEESLKVKAYTWQGALAGILGENHTANLGQIRAPTLILWGDKDTIFSHAEQETIVAAIPKARLKIYPNTGHAVHWERPDQVAQDIAEFIRR